MKTIFIDTYCFDDSVLLRVSGELYGEVSGENVMDACTHFLAMIPANTEIIAFVDNSGYGAAVADILSKHLIVMAIKPVALKTIKTT